MRGAKLSYRLAAERGDILCIESVSWMFLRFDSPLDTMSDVAPVNQGVNECSSAFYEIECRDC